MADVAELVNEILSRYGSVEAFCDRLRAVVGDPTTELPVVAVSGTVGRHRLVE